MGGHKHKGQAQRTKNNAKPANSGRIAELVDKGHQFPSFSGFNEARSPLNPSNIAVDVFSPNVDPNFTVVLKKMNKKDATTRFKALQELKELCRGSSPEVIVEVLPVWSKLYSLLAVDVEHRVREATQEVHRLIVALVGRNLAPHLKSVAPLWFLSQYDSYAPAASVASAAFQEAFPPHKITEVITYCQEEILQYIQGNLLNMTPQALSKGDLSKEDMELKYERIIICSLNGLALYLSKVALEQINKYENVHKEILSSPKFWKLSKYKSSGVRSAWFSLLSSIIQHAVHLLESEKKHVANSVIGGIDDYDSSVVSVVWETALRSFSSMQDFWQFVNIDKFFLPKFANILRVGGQGNASYIYPNILLLLNSIPSSVIKDKPHFFGKIFSSFQEGMKQPLVYQSPSESEAVLSSFVECAQYIIMKNIEDVDFCSLILEHIYQVISMSMRLPSCGHQIKPLFRHLYQMLLSWQKNDLSDNYASLQKTFWEKMSLMAAENLTSSLVEKDQFQLCLSSQATILMVLNSPAPKKRKLKVSFATEIEEVPVPQAHYEPQTKGEKTPAEKNLENNIVSFASTLLQNYLGVSIDGDYKQYQALLISQIQQVIDLFKILLLDSLEPLQIQWVKILSSWMNHHDIPIKNVLSILFEIEIFLEIDGERTMSELSKERLHECLIECLKLATEKNYPTLIKWLHSDKIECLICQEYDKIDSHDPSSFDFVKNILLVNKEGDFVIGNDTMKALIQRIDCQLSSHDKTKIKIGSEAILILLENIAIAKVNKHEGLIFELLQPLFVNIVQGRGSIVFETWQKGIVLLSKSPSGQHFLKIHLENLSGELGTYISSMETTFDVKLIHRSMMKLLSVLVDNDEKQMEDFGMPCIRLLLDSVFTKAVAESRNRIEDVCMVAEVINGNLPFNVNSDRMYTVITSIIDKWSPLDSVNTLGFVNSLVFSLKIIASALGIDIDSDISEGDDEDDASEGIAVLPSLLNETSYEFCEYLVELTYGLVLLKKMQTYYYMTKEFFGVASYVEPLEKDVRELVQRCKSNEQEKIVSMISTKCKTNGCLWTQVKEHIMDFLDGTYEVSSALVLKEDEHSIPESVLSVPHIHKLKKIIKNKGLTQNLLNEALKIVGDRYKEKYPVFNEELNHVERDYLILSAEIARLFEAAVASSPLLLSQSSLDFARISVVGWLHRIALTVNLHDNYIEFVKLTNAVCSLLTTLCKTFADDSLSQALSHYSEEWKDVFAADAFYFLCKSWEIVIEERCSNLSHVSFIHVENLGSTISTLCSMTSFTEWKSRSKIHDWVKLAMTGILIPFVPVQLTSYNLLILLLPAMMELDKNLDESSLDAISCRMIESQLSSTQMVVMAMLHDYSAGVSCSVSPFTDSYVYTLGYLLLWSALLQLSHLCPTQQKYLYPLWIKEKNLVPPLIEALVKLMPECVLYYPESSNKKGQEFFTVAPQLSFSGWTSEKLSQLSCNLLTNLLGTLPAVVRQWASEAEPKQLVFLDRITTVFISPFLSAREMEAIKGQQKSFDNMKVLTYPTVGEVIAVYTVEESSTELSIQLSSNYPLSPPKVDISKAMVSSIQTRQWLKQLTIFLTHQNGSIWDGLILWKNNLDKKFEGIEECYICFSILHTTTHQLPKLSCHTCKKKFHSFCLYKWFSTSNKSTCPICRAIF